MGKYLNPASLDKTKEEWLAKNAEVKTLDDFLAAKFSADVAWIIWLDNLIFTAAAYMFSQKEMDYFQNLLPQEERRFAVYCTTTEKLNEGVTKGEITVR